MKSQYSLIIIHDIELLVVGWWKKKSLPHEIVLKSFPSKTEFNKILSDVRLVTSSEEGKKSDG